MKLVRQLLPGYLAVLTAMILLAGAGSRAVTVMAQMQPIERSCVYWIDAGHGGEDGGTVSCTGVPESRLNLEISRRISSLLLLMGREVKMTRRTEEAVHTQGETIAQRKRSDLKNRIAMVNSDEKAILVSIHQNQYADPQYSGAQVFYKAGESSRALAQKMQAGLRNHLNPENRRTIRCAEKIYLLDQVQAPAILVECGFVSNPAEEALLCSEDYQKKISAVIATVLAQSDALDPTGLS